MICRPFTRTLLASAAIAAAIALAGCDTDGINSMPGRALAPLSEKMLAEIDQKQMEKESPILVRLFKSEAELEVWKQDRSGQYALLKTYPICRWSGDLGPKIKEGDRQAPEGFYSITPGLMNPRSQYYLAFNLGYPNAYDQANGRTGQFLMVHGDCSSRGCYAMTDEQISEIYSLARESFNGGQKAFQVQAYPFRMTPVNMAKHRNSPHMAYWKMIKQGYDHFEVTRQEPKVDVCEKHYIFDAVSPENVSRLISFNPRGKCPVFEVPQEIRDAVNEKKRQDEYQTAELIVRGTPVAPSRNGVDGGMNPVFLAKLQQGIAPTDSEGRMSLAATTATAVPGSIPVNVNPPVAPETIVEKTPAPVVLAANVPVPRPAPLAKVGTAPDNSTPTIASLIGSIFTGRPAQATAAPVENAELRGSDTGNVAAASAPKSKPAAPMRTASASTQSVPAPSAPKPVASDPAAQPKPEPAAKPPAPKAVARAPAVQPKPEPAAKPPAPKAVAVVPAIQAKPRIMEEAKAAPLAPQMLTAYTAAPASRGAGLLAGAQPVVPAGTFASR